MIRFKRRYINYNRVNVVHRHNLFKKYIDLPYMCKSLSETEVEQLKRDDRSRLRKYENLVLTLCFDSRRRK